MCCRAWGPGSPLLVWAMLSPIPSPILTWPTRLVKLTSSTAMASLVPMIAQLGPNSYSGSGDPSSVVDPLAGGLPQERPVHLSDLLVWLDAAVAAAQAKARTDCATVATLGNSWEVQRS